MDNNNSYEFIGADDGALVDYYDDFNPENLECGRPVVIGWDQDESGSMSFYRQIMPKCMQLFQDFFLKSKLGKNALVAITKYGDNIDPGGFKLIKDLSFDYNPSSSFTELLPSVCLTARRLMEYLDDIEDAGGNGIGILINMSDGGHNPNPNRKKQKNEDPNIKDYEAEAKRLIAECKKREIMTVYIEFGNDAEGMGEKLGYEKVLTTKATEKDLKEIFVWLAKSSVSVSKNMSVTDDDFDIDQYRA